MDSIIVVGAAISYARLGWYVLPVSGKVPIGGDSWQDKTTNDPAKISRLMKNADGVGVQLGPKSGIIDVECDSFEAYENLLELLGGEVPSGISFKSARGNHYLFKWSDRWPKKTVFKINGVEFRVGSDKACQSVFPPSGGRTWIVNPFDNEIKEFPALERVIALYESQIKRREFRSMPVGVGPRYGDNETLDVPKWLAKHGREIIGKTISDDAVRWHIECPNIAMHTTANAWRDCCVTQKDDGTLGGHCLHQSCGMGDWPSLRDAIGPLEHSDYQHSDNNESVDISGIVNFAQPDRDCKKKQCLEFPVECLDVPGLVGEIMAYNAKTAIYPRTELALAGALALMSTITGRKVADKWGLRTNAYFVGLCNSGGGKAHAKQVNSRILGSLGVSSIIMPKPKSGSALVSSLCDSPASLLQVDELADWLEIMKNPQKSPHTYEILGLMKEVYSESKTECWKPAGYADAKKNPVIDSPHLSFYGVAPMQVFWGSLTKQNLTDGLVGRLLTIESNTENISNDDMVDEQPPNSLLETVQSWLDFSPGDGNLKSINYRAVRIQHTEEAWTRYRDHGKRTEKRRDGESEESYAIWCRTPEKTGKLAMIRACSRTAPLGGQMPVITLEDVEWAVRLSNWVARTMIARAEAYVSENQVESNLNRILRMLDDWKSKERLGQHCRWILAKQREEIIRHAILDGFIEVREVSTPTRKRVEYRYRFSD